MSETDANRSDFLAACLQFDVRPGDVAANAASMRACVEEAVVAGARLCVLPELWSTSFLSAWTPELVDEAAAAEQELRTLSASHGLVVVGSSIEVVGDRVYNTANVYDCGSLLGSYRKIHLFSPNVEHRHHSAGEEPLAVESSVGRLGILICYDLRFPELARYYFHREVEILVVPGQWPEARSQHWRTLLRARAIENQMFVVGCNRTGTDTSVRSGEPLLFPGDGRIVDPTGEIVASGSGDAGAVVGPIELRKVRTFRRILPVARDQRPSVYRRLLEAAWPTMVEHSREHGPDLPDDAD